MMSPNKGIMAVMVAEPMNGGRPATVDLAHKAASSLVNTIRSQLISKSRGATSEATIFERPMEVTIPEHDRQERSPTVSAFAKSILSGLRCHSIGEITVSTKYFKQQLTVVVVEGGAAPVRHGSGMGNSSEDDELSCRYETLNSDSEEGDAAKSSNNESAAPTSSHAAPVATASTVALLSLGPLLGIVGVAPVPNHRQFVELDGAILPTGEDNIGDEVVQLTAKRRKQLEQHREKAAEAQSALAEEALKTMAMRASDLHTLTWLVHRMAEGYVDHEHYPSAPPSSTLDAQVQMRALLLVSNAGNVSNEEGLGGSTPAGYLLDAWYERALAHYHELIEVSTLEQRPLGVDVEAQGSEQRKLHEEAQGNYAALVGIPRLAELVGETPWPMGISQWEAAKSKRDDAPLVSTPKVLPPLDSKDVKPECASISEGPQAPPINVAPMASPFALLVMAADATDASEATGVAVSLMRSLGMKVVGCPRGHGQAQALFHIHKPLTKLDLSGLPSAPLVPVLAASSNDLLPSDMKELFGPSLLPQGRILRLVVASLPAPPDSRQPVLDGSALAAIRGGFMELEGSKDSALATGVALLVPHLGSDPSTLVSMYEGPLEDIGLELEKDLLGECDACFVLATGDHGSLACSDDGALVGSARLSEWIANELAMIHGPTGKIELMSTADTVCDRVLVVLADQESATSWSAGPSPTADTANDYHTHFFGAVSGTSFRVAPQRNTERISKSAGPSHYYTAPHVVVDVLTRPEYTRCLHRRKILSSLQEIDNSAGSDQHDDEPTLDLLKGQLATLRAQYAAVIVVAGSAGRSSLVASSQFARQSVFSLYTASTVNDAKANTQEGQTIAFVGLDDEANEMDDKPFYGDCFLQDGEDASQCRDVDVTWLSEFIADLNADAQLHTKNVLTDSDDDIADRKAITKAKPQPVSSKEDRSAISSLFQQLLERTEWPSNAASASIDVASAPSNIPIIAPSTSAEPLSSSEPLPYFGVMPPAYLFYNAQTHRTEFIITKWAKKKRSAESAEPSATSRDVPFAADGIIADQLLREAFTTLSAEAPRFPLEAYMGHDELAALMRRVKEGGHLLPMVERQRQAALLAEALGNLMVDGSASDEDI